MSTSVGGVALEFWTVKFSKYGGVDAIVFQFVKGVMHAMLPSQNALLNLYVIVNLNVIVKIVVSIILSITSEHDGYSFGCGSFLSVRFLQFLLSTTVHNRSVCSLAFSF